MLLLALLTIWFFPAGAWASSMSADEISGKLTAMTGREGEKLVFHFNFDHDSARVKKAFFSQLDEIGKALVDLKMHRYLVSVDGHTDSDGPGAYNMQLSIRRANSIKNHLTARFEVPFLDMKTTGWGETKPIRENTTKEGKTANRRVEFIISLSRKRVEKPEIYTQLAHSDGISALAFSPDSRALISGSEDKSIKLWDIGTGRLIRTFRGHSSAITAVAFSPDGKSVLSASPANRYFFSEDKPMKLWDVSTGKLIRNFEGHSNGVHAIAFSFDGKTVLSGGSDGEGFDIKLKLWDVDTGSLKRSFHVEEVDEVRALAFSPDGRKALSLIGESISSTVGLWDVAAGTRIRSFDQEVSVERCGLLTFSGDGRRAIVGTDEGISVWDVATGHLLVRNKFSGGWHNIPAYMAFSPGGKTALIGDDEKTIKLIKTATGELLRTDQFDIADGLTLINAAAFSPNGKTVALGNLLKEIKIWNVAKGKVVQSIVGNTDSVLAVTFSPDGRSALVGTTKGIRLWDMGMGKMANDFEGTVPKDSVYSIAYSADGKKALFETKDLGDISDPPGKFHLLDLAKGVPIKTFPGHPDDPAICIAFSPTGRMALSGGSLNAIRLWDITTGKPMRTLEAHSEKYSTLMFNATFSLDGKRILSGSQDTMRLWDVATGRPVRTFKHKLAVECVAFAPNGKTALSGSQDHILRLWDITTGSLIQAFQGHSNAVIAVAFSKDGERTLSGSEDKTIMLWDLKKGKPIRTFRGHSGNVLSVGFAPRGKTAMSGSDDDTLRLWDVSSGKEIVRMVSLQNGEWIVMTPDGYYKASAKGDEHMNVRIGNKVYGIDAFRKQFYRPDIIEEALRRASTGSIEHTSKPEGDTPIHEVAKIAPPSITVLSPQDRQTVRDRNSIDFSFLIKDYNLPIKSVELFVNGGRLGSRAVKRRARDKVEETVKVPLVPGENRIRIWATNGKSESEKIISLFLDREKGQRSKKPLGNLVLLAIGVGRYDHLPDDSLNYADDDAEAIAAAFKRMEGRLFKKVKTLVLSDSKIRPTSDNITDSLDFLAQAGPKDTVILFVAGHGVEDKKGHFYFLPADAKMDRKGRFRKSAAITRSAFIDALDVHGTRFFFIDACHSEGVGGNPSNRIDMDEVVKLAYQGGQNLLDTGAVIMTATRSNELARENSRLGHGFFTHALCREGLLEGKSDTDKNGSITIGELANYISGRVAELSGGSQNPASYIPGDITVEIYRRP